MNVCVCVWVCCVKKTLLLAVLCKLNEYKIKMYVCEPSSRRIHIAWWINIKVHGKKEEIKLFGRTDILRQKLVSVLKRPPFYSIYNMKSSYIFTYWTQNKREIKQKQKLFYPEKLYPFFVFSSKFFILHVRVFFCLIH